MSLPQAQDRSEPEAKATGLAEFLDSWRYFIGLLSLVLVVGLFYTEENWRGQWAWNRYQRAMAARGEPLELSAVVPPKVLDEQNFTMTPLLAGLFAFSPGSRPGNNPLSSIGLFASNYDAAVRELNLPKTVPSNSWIKARTDLPAWYEAFLNSTNKAARRPRVLYIPGKVEPARAAVPAHQAAAGVLGALSEAEPVYAELQEASKLPGARFNVHYDDEDPAAILLPHLAVVKRLSQVLALRACAQLALGRTDQAFEDTTLLLYLAGVCKDEPIMVSQLVRREQLGFALQPIAEGMSQWSEPQLRSLQAQVARFDFCADTRRALSAERYWGSAIIDFVRRSRDRFNLIGGIAGGQQPGGDLGSILMGAVPSGWYAFEKLNCSRITDEYLVPTINLTARQISPRACRLADERIADLNKRSLLGLCFHHLFFSRLVLPAGSQAAGKAAFAQTAVNCGIIACALERYRRQYGELPELLSTLQPQFIQQVPHDLINGEPLKYRRAGPGEYVPLFSRLE